ncbi:MAG: AI-2E family transporter [Acidobacteriota bacterium]
MSDLAIDREKFHRAAILLLAVSISIVFVAMIRGYLKPLFLAAIFSGLLHPLYRWICTKIGGRRTLASVITLVILLLIIVLPLSGFLGVVATQAFQLSQEVIPWVQDQLRSPEEFGTRLPEWVPFVDKLQPYTSQIVSKLGEFAGYVGTFLFNSISGATRGTARVFMSLFIMLYAMFFFLISGSEMLQKTLGHFPLTAAEKRRLVDKGVSVTRATVKGTLVIGIIQGTLAGLAFAVAGINGAAFWATTMAVLSFIPAVGTPLVWIPAVAYLYIKGQPVAATGLLIWCAAVVGTVDNFLRPRLVGGDTQMPDLLILISTLGGLSMFGAIGIVVGPIVAGLFLTVWDIFGSSFGQLLLESSPDDGDK